jgi:hypothetical protein
VLSAFASDAALILAHREVAGAPGEIPAVPTLITELTGVLFTADALHCHKDAFTQAAETDNALLVQVKQNPCMTRWPGSAPGNSPSTATRPAASPGASAGRGLRHQLDPEWQPLIACGSRA